MNQRGGLAGRCKQTTKSIWLGKGTLTDANPSHAYVGFSEYCLRNETGKKPGKWLHAIVSLTLPIKGMLAVSFFVAVSSVRAQEGMVLLKSRVAEVGRLFTAKPGNFDTLFSLSFLAQVPPAQLKAMFSQFYASLGQCVETSPVEIKNAYEGRFLFRFERDFGAYVDIALASQAPHRIIGLLVGAPFRLAKNLEDIVEEFRKLEGQKALLIARLEGDKVVPVASYHPNLQLAIGSALKLYVLAELIRAVEAGERRWEEVVRLSPEAISFPSGILQEWPVGSPLTLHSVASLMISLSDNTATDLLIQTLERKRLEDMLKHTGHSAPEKNIPFLRTLELFKLKGEPSSNLANKYINLDAEGKRTLLEGEIARMNRSRLTFPDKPHLIKSLEWFASCEDLARVLNWIRQHTNKDTTGRAILTINTGLSIPRSHWNYIGYKGGSEPGVLNLSYLLQSRKGLWYAAIATWNDEEKALEESKLFTLLMRAIQLLED